MRSDVPPPSKEDLAQFQKLIELYAYDLDKLVYVLFPFGQKGTDMEDMEPYQWQLREWRAMSLHLKNPETRYKTYRLNISSGNGAAKTAFGAMTVLMLMYTQRLKCRITANTDPQMKSVVWPEYDIWFRRARFSEFFFEKLGTSIKALQADMAESWRTDTVTWNKDNPAAISGLHNKNGAVMYVFEEAPGIPAVIWKYASGAFTETNTIKIFMAFGNSDDPESKFEQNMASPEWRSVRIDTRTLPHIDKEQIASWLRECNGNEDHDDFRVRVRGLPRKSAKDSIINVENVRAAMDRRKDFKPESVSMLPVVLGCDPAWTGGDETVIWMRQGHYIKLLEKYKLNKAEGQDHMYTFNRLCYWERVLGADAVRIDQGEGTAIYTLANNSGRYHWMLVAFNSSSTDHHDPQMREYANIRAQMYYEANKALLEGGVIDIAVENELLIGSREELEAIVVKQLCWTKGGRHKVTAKKLAESKKDIKDRVGQSPDIADGFVLTFAHPPTERLPENDRTMTGKATEVGSSAYDMPSYGDVYDEEYAVQY